MSSTGEKHASQLSGWPHEKKKSRANESRTCRETFLINETWPFDCPALLPLRLLKPRVFRTNNIFESKAAPLGNRIVWTRSQLAYNGQLLMFINVCESSF